MKSALNSAPWIVATLLLTPQIGEAQLRGGSAFDNAGAGSTLALAHGVGAIGDNPAALGLAATPTWSAAILPFVAGREAAPLDWSEVSRWSGRSIPFEERAAWMDGVTSAGGLRGRADAQLTVAALQIGNMGLQVSSRGTAQASLSEGATELLLFGNEGRSGTHPDLDLEGSVLDVEILTSVGLGWGHTLYRASASEPRSEVAVGATLTLTQSHFLMIGRDDGSLVRGDPTEVAVHFPVLESVSASPGRGASLTMGTTWVQGPWTVSAVVHDFVQLFRWDEGAFRYRPMTASFSEDQLDLDVEQHSLEEAPEDLREALRSRRLPVRSRVGAAYALNSATTVSAEFARGLVGSPTDDPAHRVALGVRIEPVTSRLGFQAGIAGTEDGLRAGGGVRLRAGPARISGAILAGEGTGGAGYSFALGVEIGVWNTPPSF